ncbi:MAG TPA: TCR/Tet family MFS transporter [Rhizomicrobium sp.]|nr:TCR/Tet family MFS transporter [Rhizomicrobium sp.]
MVQARTSRHALLFIFITMLIDMIGLGIIIPVIPKIIVSLIGGTLGDAAPYGGWLADAYAGMQFLFAPLIGNLSDHFGRRPVLILALLALGIDYTITGLAPTISWLFLGRILSGAAGGSYSTVNAYVADITPPEKRAANFGLIGAAFGLGFIIGPLLGGFFGQFGPRVPFYVSAGLAFANALYGFVVLRETLPKEDRRPFQLSRANPVGTLMALSRFPLLIALFSVFVLIQLAHDSNPAVWTYYTMQKFHWTIAEVSYSLVAVGVLSVIVSAVVTRYVVQWIGETNAVYLGLLVGGIGFAGIAFATEGWMIYAWMPFSMFMALASPSLNAIASHQVGPEEQGELQGALASLQSLSSLVAMPAMAYLFAWFTSTGAPVYFPGAPFLAAGILLAAAAAVFARAQPAQALSPAE